MTSLQYFFLLLFVFLTFGERQKKKKVKLATINMQRQIRLSK